jgi:tetratricopeptide (TPR) repeat protein
MVGEPFEEVFKIAVSDKKDNKLGLGETARATARSVYYYAERTAAGSLFVQPLNADFHPSGRKRNLTLEEFLDGYRPEPLVYYNRVKPSMDGVEQNLEKGDGLMEAGKPEAAQRCYAQALEVDDGNIRGMFGLGLAYLASGKNDDALEILGRIMHLEMAFAPEHTHLFNRFGIQMRKAGMLPQALDYYNKALALNAGDEHLHFNVCRIHYELEDYHEAARCVSTALSLNSGFTEAERMLAHLHRLRPELAEGFACAPVLSDRERYPDLDLEGAPWETD